MRFNEKDTQKEELKRKEQEKARHAKKAAAVKEAEEEPDRLDENIFITTFPGPD